jgi:regulator of sirC expression with transglutaminase-like and TPR domain
LLRESEIQAIISMLDDPDEEILNSLESRLLQEGPEIIPVLEHFWTQNTDPVKAFRIENVIKSIQQNELEKDFKAWVVQESPELLRGAELVCRIQYPGLNTETLNAYFEKIRLDAWMAMYNAFNPIDKIKILNHIFFERQGLTGNTTSYHAPENSFINKVIETRSGNPISLCIIYSIVAQRLGIPVFGVNLPQHFVLAYCDESEVESQDASFTSHGELNRSHYGKVLFYVNPFSAGQVFIKKNLDEFLKAIQVEPRIEFYETCSNIDIILRVLRNLHFSYNENHNTEKVREVAKYMALLGGEPLDGLSDKKQE